MDRTSKFRSRKFYAFIISMFLILGLVTLSAFLTLNAAIVGAAISTIGVITSAYIGFVGYQDIQRDSQPQYIINDPGNMDPPRVGFTMDDEDV